MKGGGRFSKVSKKDLREVLAKVERASNLEFKKAA
jgi:hypothetical protein